MRTQKKIPQRKKATTKKTVSKPTPKPSPSAVDESLLKQVIEALKSPALNGGFDTLLHKVDSIEKSQGHTSKKVDELCVSHEEMKEKVSQVHKAVYDPDEGLFARQHAAEARSTTFVAELTAWKGSVDKELVRDEKEDEEVWTKIDANEKKVSDIEVKVNEIIKSRRHTKGIMKWFAAAMGGGFITLLVKLLYDVISATGG